MNKNDKQFFDLLMYTALCGRADSEVLVAAEEEDYEFFKKFEEDYRRKRGLDKLTKQAQELDMGYPKE